MHLMTQDLKDSAASVLNDPFNKNSMVGLSTWCSLNEFTGQWSYSGRVAFKNGNTEGESLNALLIKMQAFVETLDK